MGLGNAAGCVATDAAVVAADVAVVELTVCQGARTAGEFPVVAGPLAGVGAGPRAGPLVRAGVRAVCAPARVCGIFTALRRAERP
ncbi:hypothetical protein GCM10023205_22170 [Yinghuangia aomiensis]|uniref:Uncharacterized protein n=1 Tax=Yinghuangia aomiensis TaxID=676205 RepID=A0ABP9H3A2_9ACTN